MRKFTMLLMPVFMLCAAGLGAAADGPVAPAPDSALPLRSVTLFSSGVGYFERAGMVRDAARVPLSFRTETVNDILKSLVLFDPSEGVSGVTFDSRDSFARRLQDAGLSLGANASLGDLLRQVQGTEVEVRTKEGSQRGRVVSVNTRKAQVGPTTSLDVESLNLLAPGGLQVIPVDEIIDIKLLDATVDARLSKGLQLLSERYSDELRNLSLNFGGKGEREVRAGYLQETPVWKTSYRLVLDDGKKPYLQGWAIVENTTTEDWSKVALSLVSGRPISFIQDLYQPLYVERPVVEQQVDGAPESQLYAESVNGRAGEDEAGDGRSESRVTALENRPQGRRTPFIPPGQPAAIASAGGVSRKFAMARGMGSGRDRAIPRQAVRAQAEAAARGELFEYAIREPVSIPRQSAAMVPIVSQDIDGEKLSIFDADSGEPYALSGFRLKNSKDLQLAGGPITVYDDGIYAGDAQVATVARKDDRLISYAMDLDLVISPGTPSPYRQVLSSFNIKAGVLRFKRQENSERVYNLRNKSTAAKTVLVQQRVVPGFSLVGVTPAESTATEYRFKVSVPAGQTVKLVVPSMRPIDDRVALLYENWNSLQYYARNSAVPVGLQRVLGDVLARRRRIEAINARAQSLHGQIENIYSDQERIRENLGALKEKSPLRDRYLSKLNAQESALERLSVQLAAVRVQREKAQEEFRGYLGRLNVN